MKKLLMLSVLCGIILGSTTLVGAKPGDTLWTRTYGGSGSDYAYSVQETTDGGYIIAGETVSFGAGYHDFYLVKTDAGGDTLWTRTYGGGGADRARSVQQTADGGYIIAGWTDSFGAGEDDFYLVKTSSSGDTLWTRTYGGSNYDQAYSVQQTTDGGYIIAGLTESFGAGDNDFYLVKTDDGGNALWMRTYGGSYDDEASSVQQTTDGEYIIAGETRSFGAGVEDFYLVKTDASGDALWTQTYGGSSTDESESVQQTTDGGYIIAGRTHSFGAGSADFYLVKTDASGDTLWTRTYGGSNGDWAYSVQQTTDGGYIIAGWTRIGVDYYDFYLVKTDTGGDTLWTRTYGGSNTEWAYSVQQTTDGGYILAGFTNSFGAGYQDFYLVKTIGYPDQNKLLPESVLYYDDLDGDTLHDPGEPYFTSPDGHEVRPDVSCWFASACNLLVYEGGTNPYLYGLGDGAAPSPNISPWGNVITAPGGGAYMTFDDGGWPEWALSFAGQPSIETIKTQTEFGIGAWTINPISWCRTRLSEWHGIGIEVWWGSVPEGTLPGRFDPKMPFLYHSLTLWEINEDDSTVTITDSDDGISGVRVLSYTYSNNDWVIQELYPGGNERVNYAAYIDTVIVLVEEPTSNENIPSGSLLANNYPNPFNPTTTIEYQLPFDSNVKLEIFNLRGQKVATLVDGDIPAGKHQVSWDASQYSSGIYFYRLAVGEKSITKRLALLK